MACSTSCNDQQDKESVFKTVSREDFIEDKTLQENSKYIPQKRTPRYIGGLLEHELIRRQRGKLCKSVSTV